MSTCKHSSDEALELYSLGRLAEPELSSLEEHLVVCRSCQSRLTAEDEFNAAARGALARLERHGPPESVWVRLTRWRWPGFVWAGGAAFAAILLVTFVARQPARQDVPLYASRGAAHGSAARVSAQSAVRLQIDMTELGGAGTWRIEVANHSGATVWQSEVSSEKRVVEVEPGSLRAGTYWVRVYAAGEKDPLREFSLTAE